MKLSTFDGILDEIETLPLEDQLALLDIMQRRLSDRRRDEIAANIAQAKKEHKSGHVFRGTVNEAIAELNR